MSCARLVPDDDRRNPRKERPTRSLRDGARRREERSSYPKRYSPYPKLNAGYPIAASDAIRCPQHPRRRTVALLAVACLAVRSRWRGERPFRSSGEAKIEQCEGRRLLPKKRQGFLPVLRAGDIEPHEPEPIREQFQNVGVVVDDENPRSPLGHVWLPVPSGVATSVMGRVKTKRLPAPGRLSTRMRPP